MDKTNTATSIMTMFTIMPETVANSAEARMIPLKTQPVFLIIALTLALLLLQPAGLAQDEFSANGHKTRQQLNAITDVYRGLDTSHVLRYIPERFNLQIEKNIALTADYEGDFQHAYDIAKQMDQAFKAHDRLNVEKCAAALQELLQALMDRQQKDRSLIPFAASPIERVIPQQVVQPKPLWQALLPFLIPPVMVGDYWEEVAREVHAGIYKEPNAVHVLNPGTAMAGIPGMPAKRPVKQYDVGEFGELENRSVPHDNLVLHHVPQKFEASKLIPGYDPETAPTIVLKSTEHWSIPTYKGPINPNLTAAELIQRDLTNLRRYTQTPQSQMNELIDLIIKKYGLVLRKLIFHA